MARSKTHRGQAAAKTTWGRPRKKRRTARALHRPAAASCRLRPAERSRPRQRAERVRGHVQLEQLSKTAPERRPQSNRPLRRPDDAVECLPRDAEIASVEADDVQAAVRTRYAHCRCGRRRAETPAAVRAAARGPFRRSHGICAAQTVLIDRLLCTAFSSRPAPFKGW